MLKALNQFSYKEYLELLDIVQRFVLDACLSINLQVYSSTVFVTTCFL